MAKILLVDDELTILQLMQKVFVKQGYDVTLANDGTEAVAHLKEEDFDLLVTDIRMKEMGGLEVLKVCQQLKPDLTVVMMTAYAAIDTAVESMKNGAFDYICKPFKIDEILLTVQRALEYSAIKKENKILKASIQQKYHYEKLIGESSMMQDVYSKIGKLSRTECSALIQGDAGVGKGLLARAIHFSSKQKLKPFVVLNCRAFLGSELEEQLFGKTEEQGSLKTVENKGCLFSAAGGTLYLDEIDAMPLSVQLKLVSCLTAKEYRVKGEQGSRTLECRILASSDKDISTLIEQKAFSSELYYALNIISLSLPLLKDRLDDLPLLVKHFIDDFNDSNKREVSIAMNAVRALSEYDWPNNVRELESVVKRAAVLCDNDLITIQDLPDKISVLVADIQESLHAIETYRGYSLKKFLREKEKEYIDHVLHMAGGNKEKAAEVLGVSLATFYRKYNDPAS